MEGYRFAPGNQNCYYNLQYFTVCHLPVVKHIVVQATVAEYGQTWWEGGLSALICR